jgi:hypothetical protein
VVVEAVSLERMKKRARVRTARPGATVFTIECDEGPHIGGDDTAPSPLAYFTTGVAF